MPQGTPPVRALYISGLGRNGGTLMDRVLGEISGFFSLGEFRFLWAKGARDNELCNCGKPFRDCPFWNAVLADAFGEDGQPDPQHMVDLARSVDRTRWIPWLMSPLRPRRFNALLEEHKAGMSKVLHALSRQTDGAVLVDSSKFASRAMIIGMLPDVELYVVHLVRDSRAVAYSWTKTVRKKEAVEEVKYMRRYNPAHTALQWLYRNLVSHLLPRYTAGHLRLRYEDFAASPVDAVRRITALVDESSANLPFVADDTVELGTSHTQSGNPMRFTTGEVKIRPDMAWRNELPSGTRFIVTLLTWPLLLRYGYRLF